ALRAGVAVAAGGPVGCERAGAAGLRVADPGDVADVERLADDGRAGLAEAVEAGVGDATPLCQGSCRLGRHVTEGGAGLSRNGAAVLGGVPHADGEEDARAERDERDGALGPDGRLAEHAVEVAARRGYAWARDAPRRREEGRAAGRAEEVDARGE